MVVRGLTIIFKGIRLCLFRVVGRGIISWLGGNNNLTVIWMCANRERGGFQCRKL